MLGVTTNVIGNHAVKSGQTKAAEPSAQAALVAFSASGRQVSIACTVVMLALHFGFILLIAYAKDGLSVVLAPGLSLAMVFGGLLVIAAFLLTLAYVCWSNRRDRVLNRLAEAARAETAR
jgi:uncharacterized membrane protein (DUF485 family)